MMRILLLCLPVVAFSAELKAVYPWWDDANKQHTFHFPPAWTHGQTQETQGSEPAFYAYDEQVDGSVPIHNFWDDVNKQHTHHTGDAWTGETIKSENPDFFAFDSEVNGAEAVYAWWDDVNKQHTFHFPPAWKHGETDETQGDIIFYAFRTAAGPTEPPTPELQSVFDFWDDGAKQHTFHFAPAWGNEKQGRAQYQAWTHKTDATEAIYDFWDTVNKQNTFHFPPAWDNEEQRNIQYYAYPAAYDGDMTGLVAIHDFWDDVNKQHTFHAPPAWPNEVAGELRFYAHDITDDLVQPVYAWWDDANKQHTFHFPPAWDHGGTVETQGGFVFSTYSGHHNGTEPVYDWWDDDNKQHTFHFEPAWNDNEVKGEVQFYAFRDQANPNLEPVHDYWDKVNKQHTFHMDAAWQNEEKKAIQFYAYRTDGDAWVPPTDSPTPAPTNPGETITKAFGFTSSQSIEDTEAFLAKCTEALEGYGAQCTAVMENEGDIEVHVEGPENVLADLEQSGWATVLQGADMAELESLIEDYEPMPAGDNPGGEMAPPTIGAKTVNDTDASAACQTSVVCAAGVVGVFGMLA